MAYDVYKTFAKQNSGFKNKNNQKFVFIIYSLYAWLLPAIIIIISLIVEANLPFDSPYSPAYGKTICAISHLTALLIFFMMPLSIILALNVMLFIITAHKLKLITNEIRFATKRKAKNRLSVHIKLVLLLGLTWILGFLAMFIKVDLISYPSIILHGLHGAFIFIAFTVKRSVFLMLKLRIKYLCGRRETSVSIVRLNEIRLRLKAKSIETSSTTSWSDFLDRSQTI